MKAFLAFLICHMFLATVILSQPVPYDFDKKPTPTSLNWTKILPKIVRKYTQTKLQLSSSSNCLFSCLYTYGSSTITLSGYIQHQGAACIDITNTMTTCEGESGKHYNFEICPENITFNYNKGSNTTQYYLSASAKNRQELDIFMKLFPY